MNLRSLFRNNSKRTFSKQNSSETMSEVAKFIEQENASHKVVVWSKTHCGYCVSTKELLTSLDGLDDVVIHDLDRRSDGAIIQRELFNLTGQHTVPNVFIMNQHIGGDSDTQKLYRTGKLNKLLKL